MRFQRTLICSFLSIFSFVPLVSSAADLPVNPQTYSSIPYRGVNLSGAEFKGSDAKSVLPNIPTSLDTWYFVYKGVNTLRIPFALEYLVPPSDLKTPVQIDFNSDYAKALVNLINELTIKQPKGKALNVILDMHNYMHYNPGNLGADYDKNNKNFIGYDLIDPQSCPSGACPTADQYAAIWGQIAAQFAKNPFVSFELMNEPQAVLASQALAIQNKAIAAIRGSEQSSGASAHVIILDGAYWSGLHSFVHMTPDQPIPPGEENASIFTAKSIIDPANKYMIDVHQYFDPDSSGQYNQGCASPSQFVESLSFNDFKKWARTNNIKVILGEFGAPYLTLDPDSQKMLPVPYLNNCRADFQALLDLVTQDPADFAGFTVWSSGHGWGDYLMNVSQGGPANPWMDDAAVMGKYFTSVAKLPPLGKPIAAICNKTAERVLGASAMGPFQGAQPGGMSPSECRYVYSNDGTENPKYADDPAHYATLTYQLGSTLGGIGLNNPDSVYHADYAYSWGTLGNYKITSMPNTNCSLNLSVKDSRCYWVQK